MSLKLVVLDRDDRYARLAEASITASGHVVVGRFSDADEAVAMLVTAQVDVVLVDPSSWGAHVVARLRAADESVKPVVVCDAPSLELVTACIDAGAQGFVSKRTDPTRLPELMLEAVRGDAPVSQDAGRRLLDLVRRTRQRANSGVIVKPLLSPREREVLEMLVDGRSYTEVADALGISLGTVQTHIKSLYRKLDVTSKAAAVTVALRNRLV